MMNRQWLHCIWISSIILLLAGCGKTVEEQITDGLAFTEAAFEETEIEANTEIGKIAVYVPRGYTVEEGATDMNYIFSKGKESFILFINTIEAEDSRLHYELLKNDKNLQIIKEETFENNEAFGFTAVIEHGEEQFELIVSSGGVKMTTLSEGKRMDEKLTEMTEIVLSAKPLDSTKE